MSEWLREYKDAIDAGGIIAGLELKRELDRLVGDLDAGWHYDTHDAELRINLMQGCFRLTKSPFYGDPMVLLLWQKAFIEALYSFKMDDGTDRFKKALLWMAKKNAKSEMASGLLLAESIVGMPGSEIVASSNDDKQAGILYDATDTMRRMIDPKGRDLHRNNRGIYNLTNGSRIFKLSGKTYQKDGYAIDFAVVDEVHEMLTNMTVSMIEQAQSTKRNPKLLLITSEGVTRDGFFDAEKAYARKVLEGELDDEAAVRYLPWLYTQDSEEEIWQDESSWQKSSPSLDIIKPRAYLVERLAKARESTPDRIFVLAKDFNLAQGGVTSWLSLETYDYEATFELSGFKDSFCLGGVDMSETTDLTCAKILLMKPGDSTKYVFTRYWIPEAKLQKSPDEAAGARYAQWAEQGWLEVVEGNDIDLAQVADWFYSLYDTLGIRPYKIGYDQRFAKQFLRRMDEYGLEHEMIVQNADTLSNAIKLVEADLISQRLNYQANPVDRWCLGNASIQINRAGQALIIKPQNRASHRIDGAVCFAILEEVYLRYRSDFNALVNSG